MFSQFQLHTCTYQNYLEDPPSNPRETSERINFNLNCLYIDIWCLFFKKKCHKMIGPPFCHLDQWLIFIPASQRLALISGTGTACSLSVMWKKVSKFKYLSLDIVLWKIGVSIRLSVDQYDQIDGFSTMPMFSVSPKNCLISFADVSYHKFIRAFGFTGTRIPDPPFSSFGPSRDYSLDLCLEVYLWTIYPYFTTFRVTTLSFY